MDLRDRLEYTQYLANILLWSGQYARSVDICDQILEEDGQYYPAVLTRQEASYKLHKSQQVVDATTRRSASIRATISLTFLRRRCSSTMSSMRTPRA